MLKYFLLILPMILMGCSCDNDSCKMEGFFSKNKSQKDESSLKPWEKPHETVSGVRKEEVGVRHKFLILETQTLSTKEIILKRKREEEKKSPSVKSP